MDKEIFVQNIKKLCSLRGIKPTIACRESGAGADLINQVERRGSVPSVERVQLLANYLGVTVSELLGEEKPAPKTRDGLSAEQLELVSLFSAAPPALRVAALAVLKAAEARDKIQGGASKDK